jgi:hypothetical protein
VHDGATGVGAGVFSPISCEALSDQHPGALRTLLRVQVLVEHNAQHFPKTVADLVSLASFCFSEYFKNVFVSIPAPQALEYAPSACRCDTWSERDLLTLPAEARALHHCTTSYAGVCWSTSAVPWRNSRQVTTSNCCCSCRHCKH